MKKYLLVFAVLIFVSSPSFAVVEFVDVDTDKDKYISLEEATGYELFSSVFALLDADEDGRISTMEFEDFDQTADMGELEETTE